MTLEFVGTFHSDDAYNPASEPDARFALYPAGGTIPLTLGSTQSVVITDIDVSCEVDITVVLFDGPDLTIDPPDVILRAHVRNFSTVTHNLVTPHACRPGSYPKIAANGSGGVAATVRGYIESRG